MSQILTQIFSKIPPEDFSTAVQCGLLLGSAASIFYLFFGRLLSIPELLSITLKNPTCKPCLTQQPNPGTPSSLSQALSSLLPFWEPSTMSIFQGTFPSTMRSTWVRYPPSGWSFQGLWLAWDRRWLWLGRKVAGSWAFLRSLWVRYCLSWLSSGRRCWQSHTNLLKSCPKPQR